MEFFRMLGRSKAGKYIAAAILLVIALAFAAGDITGSGGLGALGGQGAGEVARIGSMSISTSELQNRAQRFFERYRQDKPELTMAQFISQGGLRQVLDEMIAVKALI